MQFIFYGILFIVIVSAVGALIQNALYPPVEIQPSELPDVLKSELSTLFPKFAPDRIKFMRLRHRYTLEGQFEGRPGKIFCGLTPDEELAEIEFKDVSGTCSFTNQKRIQSTLVPSQIAEIMKPYLASDATSFESSRASSGMIGSENAFKIKINSEDYEYEFEITESGRLVEFEKEHIGY
jgi:hypothetical protein